MSKPVILHVINSLTIGGAEMLLKNSVNLLHGYKHIVVYLSKPDMLMKEFDSDVEFICLFHKGWFNSYETINKLKKIIRNNQPIFVHAHLFESTLLARLAVSKRIPLLFTIHNILSKDAFEVNRLSLYAERLTYKKWQTLIAVSKEALIDYDRFVGLRGKNYVLYNYVDQQFFDLVYNYEQKVKDQFKLVAVGSLRRQKNYFKLLEAFEIIKHLPIELDIYGSGDLYEELNKIIVEKGLKVKLSGRSDNIAGELMNYHAYIMSSTFEGFGIAPMEAMAAGMPVILSDLEVFREIAGDQPVYFDPNSATSIAQSIEFAYNNWSSIISKSRKNKDLIKEIASREVYLHKLKEIYSNH